MPHAFVVSEVRTVTKVVAAFAVALLALATVGQDAGLEGRYLLLAGLALFG